MKELVTRLPNARKSEKTAHDLIYPNNDTKSNQHPWK